MAVKLRKVKAPQSTLRLESGAEAAAGGVGQAAGRTIEEGGDWVEVEKTVRSFVAIRGAIMQLRVLWTATYGVPTGKHSARASANKVIPFSED